MGLAALAGLRLSAAFHRCREEQGPDCAASFFTLAFASLPEASKGIRYLAALLALAATGMGFRALLKRDGHLAEGVGLLLSCVGGLADPMRRDIGD